MSPPPVVFLGPSLDRATAERAAPGVRVLPPAAQGDLYRVAAAGARLVGLVDGYFEGVPAVMHKEILWALDRGVAVLGAASMGALRAAELHPFGMRGVGAIFAAYRDGRLEDDDEVALAHGPAGTGFVALSEPMVNVRATLDAAVAAGVVGAGAAAGIGAAAKAIFYADRTWAAVLEAARERGHEAGDLASWLPGGRVDRKREDALALLAALARDLRPAPEPVARARPPFEWTLAFDDAVASWSSVPAPPLAAGAAPPAAWVADEIRLDPTTGAERVREARERLLALRAARARRAEPPREARLAALNRLRAEHGLFARASLEAWLTENDLDEAGLESLAADDARLEAVRAEIDAGLDEALVAIARRRGEYAAHRARAARKRAWLHERGIGDPSPADCGMRPRALVAWHFRQRRSEPPPEAFEEFLGRIGVASRDAFCRILAREYLYSRDNEES